MNLHRSPLLILIFAATLGFLHLGMKNQPEKSDMKDFSHSMQVPRMWSGKFAPDFELTLMDGEVFRLSEHIGKEVIILNFFATWCGPCKKEMPELNRFNISKDGDPVTLIGVDADEKRPVVETFISKFGVTFPVGIDDSRQIQRSYGVNSFPTTVLIGVDGKIQLYEVGAISNADIAFGSFIEDNLKKLAEGDVVSAEKFLTGVTEEDYKELVEEKKKDEHALEGRALTIAKNMDCVCGCSKKVNECSCSTAKKIKKSLKAGGLDGKTNVEIVEALNAEFCMKEM